MLATEELPEAAAATPSDQQETILSAQEVEFFRRKFGWIIDQQNLRMKRAFDPPEYTPLNRAPDGEEEMRALTEVRDAMLTLLEALPEEGHGMTVDALQPHFDAVLAKTSDQLGHITHSCYQILTLYVDYRVFQKHTL